MWRRLAALLALCLLALTGWWFGCVRAPSRHPFAQPEDFVWTVEPSDHAPIASGRYSLDSLASGPRGHPGLPRFRFRRLTPRDILHPDLHPLLAASPSDTQGVLVVIGFPDHTPMERLPLHLLATSFDSAASALGQQAVDSVFERVDSLRAAEYARQANRLTLRYGAVVGRGFTLTQALVARVPRGRLRALVETSGAISVRPLRTRGVPPQGAPPLTSVLSAAMRLGLVETKSAGLTGGRIRLLDTGVDANHVYFAGLPAVDPPPGGGAALITHDCILSPACNGTAPGDCDPSGHGTPSTGILVAGPGAPEVSRGVVLARLHAYRVWWNDAGYMTYDADAIHDALRVTNSFTPDVAAIQVCDGEGPDGVIAGSANGAFDAGIAVVAAIGNTNAFDENYTGTGARSPGNARGVLGIGARPADAPGSTAAGQGYGGVLFRVKPDLQTYTGSRSAKPGGGDMAHAGTSGATPYAAACALAMRKLLEVATPIVDPGQVYAALIACGSEVRAPSGRFPEDKGVGLIRLPHDGRTWFNRLSLGNGGKRKIKFHIDNASAREIRIGLWWRDPAPLYGPQSSQVVLHRDFDVELIDPSGTVVARSVGAHGVFERLTWRAAPGQTLATGDWRIRILAPSVGPQHAPVYWTVIATP